VTSGMNGVASFARRTNMPPAKIEDVLIRNSNGQDMDLDTGCCSILSRGKPKWHRFCVLISRHWLVVVDPTSCSSLQNAPCLTLNEGYLQYVPVFNQTDLATVISVNYPYTGREVRTMCGRLDHVI
jgi:hypothetical protein